MVESPRTTLQRYGIPYQPYNFKGDEDDSVVSASEVSGVSGGVSDHSSVGDSGVYSETSDRTREKKGFSEFLSKEALLRILLFNIYNQVNFWNKALYSGAQL